MGLRPGWCPTRRILGSILQMNKQQLKWRGGQGCKLPNDGKMRADVVTLSSDSLVKKSPNDRRLYRYLQLHNGLCVLLVHDPDIYAGHPEEEEEEDDDDEEDDDEEDDDDDDDDEEDDEDAVDHDEGLKRNKAASPQTKKAAAAVCLGMGSFSDPYEAQGLAHFLEHMLFMGSTAFPDENEYDSYLSKHGGSSNAYTETEHTCYHFDVKRDFLKGALERFSHFFISPLVKGEAMEREVLAVDSEFNQVLQSDSCRLQQLQCQTSIPGHPFNRFFWGNKKSLMEAMEKGDAFEVLILLELIFVRMATYGDSTTMKTYASNSKARGKLVDGRT